VFIKFILICLIKCLIKSSKLPLSVMIIFDIMYEHFTMMIIFWYNGYTMFVLIKLYEVINIDMFLIKCNLLCWLCFDILYEHFTLLSLHVNSLI